MKTNTYRNSLMAAMLVLVVCLPLAAQPIARTIKRLPDTGQTGDYTPTRGEDSDYNINPPGFLVQGGVAIDTVTTLMWQRTDGGEMTVEQAMAYCDTLTLGGYDDWRLPASHELFSIQNLGNSNPALNTAVFTASGAEYWWSADRHATDSNRVWATNAGGGIGPHPKTETIGAGGNKRFHVRAVRNTQNLGTVARYFTDNGDQTVTDNMTGLTWQQFCVPELLTWEEALRAADTMQLAGHADWRLPSIRELQSLNREARLSPSVELLYFPCVAGADKLWSSTTLMGQGFTRAWLLQADVGIVTYDLKTARCKVLCVRGGTEGTTSVRSARLDQLACIVTPNPAHGGVEIGYGTDCACMAYITVTDARGRTVASWATRAGDAGRWTQPWETANIPSGLYYCTVQRVSLAGTELARNVARIVVVH